MLPSIDGITLLREIRADERSARDHADRLRVEEADRGPRPGARGRRLRHQAVLPASSPPACAVCCGAVSIAPMRRRPCWRSTACRSTPPLARCTVGGAVVGLTPKEFDLLAFLAASPRQVFLAGAAARQRVGLGAGVPGPGDGRPSTCAGSGRRSRPIPTTALDHHGLRCRLPVRTHERLQRPTVDAAGLAACPSWPGFIAFVAAVVVPAMVLLHRPAGQRASRARGRSLTLPAAVAVAAVPLLRRWW